MDTTTTPGQASVRYLPRPGGRLAYTVRGKGPLMVCTPGMGDLRTTFRDLSAALVDAGYRVAEMDLRGHGDSDTTFVVHGDVATGTDILALVDHLGGPAVLVGNSMGAAASLWAAAERPAAVAGVVLLGPFVRDADASPARARLLRAAIRFSLLRPWGPAAWAMAYRSFVVGKDRGSGQVGNDRGSGQLGRDRRRGEARVRGRLPADFDAHVAQIRANLRDPARLRSLRHLVAQLRHRVVEERLDEVSTPALVLMGAQDPDFADPAAEVAYIEARLSASGKPVTAHLVPECGHYPQSQRPDVVVPAALRFLATVPRDRSGWLRPDVPVA